MKLFTKSIDQMLFKQYSMGNNMNQKVVAKIFNPYGRGYWYILNSDPDDPDYLWAIVDYGQGIEVGSVSRRQLETMRVKPFMLPLERDLGFSPRPAKEIFEGLKQGKHFEEGGEIEDEGGENKEMLENQSRAITHHAKELSDVVKKTKEVEPWVITKTQRASTDLSDVTHYLEGERKEKYADGGQVNQQYQLRDSLGRYFYRGTDYKEKWSDSPMMANTFSMDEAKLGKVKLEELGYQGIEIVPFDRGSLKSMFKSYKHGGNITNSMRGEEDDEYGTFELMKRGGRIDVKIVKQGESFNPERYNWLMGDYDSDGVRNSDDKDPQNSNVSEKIDSPSLSSSMEFLLNLKNSMDENMYSFVDDLKSVAPDNSKIYARTKTPYSILNKLVTKRLLNPKTGLTDLIGTTIVTSTKSELDKVKNVINSGKMGNVIEFEDMYENPKGGYRAYHFLVERGGMPVEVQLKTKRQKAINELSHEPYKLKRLDSDKLLEISKIADEADRGNKASIIKYNNFMNQPDLENVFLLDNGEMMSKGGRIRYTSKNDKDYTSGQYPHYKKYPKAIGSFAWFYPSTKINEGIIYPLDDFDNQYYSHLKLKDGEYLLRYRTDRMKTAHLIKFNFEKSLIYFLSDVNDEDDKNPRFESRGIKADYIVIEWDSLNHKMSKGGQMKDVKDLEGHYVKVYLLGVKEPIISTIEKATIDDPKYRHRYVRLELLDGAEETIPLNKFDEFTNGQKVELRDGKEPYMLQLVKSKASGGKMADGGATKRKTKKEKEQESINRRMRKRYYVKIYHGGEMPDEVKIFENLADARNAARSGEHSTILDLLTNEEVFAYGGKMAKGGATFADKVSAIKSRLKGTKVPARLKKDYGKRYNAEEAEMAAKRIAGSMRKKEM